MYSVLNELCIVLILLFRFLSIPKGFSYLNERGYVSKQLDKWQKVFLKYQQIAKECLYIGQRLIEVGV